MEINAVLAQAVYLKKKDRMKEVEKYYGDRFEMLPESDNAHLIVVDTETGKVHFAIRGTDITNTNGKRIKDLGTDILAGMGLHRIGSRYKNSDKKLNKIKKTYENEIVLTGHSLGATITRDLSLKHNLESHSFNSGGSHKTFGMPLISSLHPKNKEKIKKNNVYFTKPKGIKADWLSIGTSLDPMANVKWIEPKKLSKDKKGVLEGHSIHHFFPHKPEHGIEEEKEE